MSLKSHWQKHKTTYLASGVTAIVVGGVTYFLVRRTGVTMIDNVEMLNQVKQTGIINKNTIEVYVEALGDPGNIVQDLTTGTIYASQNQAAKELGVYPARLTEHFQGKLPDVNGHVFQKIAKASVAPLDAAA